MTDLIYSIQRYMAYPFIRYALITGVLVALCASLLGVILVLKRYSFIGDGLSHVAFGALAIASVLRINNKMIVVLPITIICAVILLCTKSSASARSAPTTIPATKTAAGSMWSGLRSPSAPSPANPGPSFPASSNINGDVCGTLFGSTLILTLSKADVWLCVLLSAAVIAIFTLFYNKIFAVTFDESFAASGGINVRVFNILIAVMCAIIIVLAMNLAGSLLTSALIVFPAISAMRIFKSFRGVIICSAVLAVICAAGGIMASILFSTPVGSTVVAANIAVFLICCAAGRAR